jgi:hypothetical protein
MASGIGSVVIAVLLASCGGGSPSTHSSNTTSTQPATTTTTQSLQSVAWTNVTVPAEVCPGLSQPVMLTATSGLGAAYGSATIPAPVGHQFGTPDDLIEEGGVFYGPLEPVGNVAALYVWCSNTGGTADGQIQNSLVVYSWVSGQLSVLATLTPQQLGDGGSHVPYFDESAGGITISTGSITTKELFYGGQDATCCPSGRATTVWIFNGHAFSPITTVQVQPAGTGGPPPALG